MDSMLELDFCPAKDWVKLNLHDVPIQTGIYVFTTNKKELKEIEHVNVLYVGAVGSLNRSLFSRLSQYKNGSLNHKWANKLKEILLKLNAKQPYTNSLNEGFRNLYIRWALHESKEWKLINHYKPWQNTQGK